MDRKKNSPTVQVSSAHEAPDLSGVDLVRFNCILNSAYNDDRERHYAALHKFMMLIVVICGAAAFGFEMSGNVFAPILTFAAAAAGTFDLVFDLDGKARLHANLKRKYYELRARCENSPDLTHIREEIIRNFGDEPPTMHAVNALAFNAAVDALGRPKDQRYVLTLPQFLLRHWLPYRANIFPIEGNMPNASRVSA